MAAGEADDDGAESPLMEMPMARFLAGAACFL